MFGLVKRLRARARQRARALFSFWDGERTRYVDPLQVHRKLTAVIDWESEPHLYDACQEPEATEFVVKVADAFGVDRWDSETDSGLTDEEIILILNSLYEWMDTVKKNGSDTPTPSDVTDQEPESNNGTESTEATMSDTSD